MRLLVLCFGLVIGGCATPMLLMRPAQEHGGDSDVTWMFVNDGNGDRLVRCSARSGAEAANLAGCWDFTADDSGAPKPYLRPKAKLFYERHL